MMRIIPIRESSGHAFGTKYSPIDLTITSEQIDAAIATTEFVLSQGETTLCVARLHNGYTVVGQSTSQSQTFNKALEQQFALEDAHCWVRPLLSYELNHSLWLPDHHAANMSGAHSPARGAATLGSQTNPIKLPADTSHSNAG